MDTPVFVQIANDLMVQRKKNMRSPTIIYMHPELWDEVRKSPNFLYSFPDVVSTRKGFLGKLFGMEVFSDESITGWRFEFSTPD